MRHRTHRVLLQSKLHAITETTRANMLALLLLVRNTTWNCVACNTYPSPETLFAPLLCWMMGVMFLSDILCTCIVHYIVNKLCAERSHLLCFKWKTQATLIETPYRTKTRPPLLASTNPTSYDCCINIKYIENKYSCSRIHAHRTTRRIHIICGIKFAVACARSRSRS